jgi:hypothetical protein
MISTHFTESAIIILTWESTLMKVVPSRGPSAIYKFSIGFHPITITKKIVEMVNWKMGHHIILGFSPNISSRGRFLCFSLWSAISLRFVLCMVLERERARTGFLAVSWKPLYGHDGILMYPHWRYSHTLIFPCATESLVPTTTMKVALFNRKKRNAKILSPGKDFLKVRQHHYSKRSYGLQ